MQQSQDAYGSSDGLRGVHFSAARRAECDELCDDLIERALETHERFHADADLSSWRLVRRREAVSVYRPRGSQPQGVDGSRVLLGSGILAGTREEAISGVYCDSTPELRVVKRLLSDKFVNGAVLRVFEAQGPRAAVSFAGIKWFIMRGATATTGLVSDRDMLTYERMGRIVDRHGEHFSYHVLQSVDLPEFPPNHDKRVQRMQLSWCYLYRQLSPEWVGCFMLGDLDLATSLPDSMARFLAAERILSVGNFLKVTQAKHFSALIASSASQESSTDANSTPLCVVCLSPPVRLLGSTHKRCMGCGRPVCLKHRQRRVIFQLQPRSGKPETARFCRLCVDAVTNPNTSGGSEELATLRRVMATGSDASSSGSESGTSQHATTASPSVAGFSEDATKMRLSQLASFALRCHDGSRRIRWNREELRELSRFLDDESQRTRRRERRRARSEHRSDLQASRSAQNCPRQPRSQRAPSPSSWTANGPQGTSPGCVEPPSAAGVELYDFSGSPTVAESEDRLYEEEPRSEPGPWRENEPKSERLNGSQLGGSSYDALEFQRPDRRHASVCIDELD